MPGRKGRNARPGPLRLVDGTHRKDRHGDKQVAQREARDAKRGPCPGPPEEFPDRARAEWERVGPALHDRGLLTERDVAVFTAYCLAVSDMMEAREKLEDRGLIVKGRGGGKVRNPAFSIAAEASRQVRQLSVELGMTPSARAGLPPEAPGQEDDVGSFRSKCEKSKR